MSVSHYGRLPFVQECCLRDPFSAIPANVSVPHRYAFERSPLLVTRWTRVDCIPRKITTTVPGPKEGLEEAVLEYVVAIFDKNTPLRILHVDGWL